MKPDEVTMESTEPTEDAAGAEPASTQDNIVVETRAEPEAASNSAEAAGDAPEANGKPQAKVQPQVVGKKAQQKVKSSGASVSTQQPGNASHRVANDSRSHNATAATSRNTAAAAGAIPKKTSMAKNHPRVPAGAARSGPAAAAAATVANGTKPTAGNGSLRKRPGADTVNGARPKTSASANRNVASTLPKSSSSTTTKAVGLGGAAGCSSRTAASTLSKPSTSTRPKVGGGAAASESRMAASTFSKSSSSTQSKAFSAAASKTTRPATAPSTSRPPPTTSRPGTATGKAITSSAVSSTSAVKTAASRVTTLPSTGRNIAVQPPKPVAVAKKDASRSASTMAAKKPTASPAPKKNEPTKSMAAMRLTSASNVSTAAKGTDAKLNQAAKGTPSKTSVAQTRFPVNNKPPLSRSVPSSPATKSANVPLRGKVAGKPSQIVQPFTGNKKKVTAAAAVGPLGQVDTASVKRLEQSTTGSKSPPPTSPPDVLEETPCQSTAQSPSTSATLPPATGSAIPPILPPTNLNEEEDEEEREGSQLVSVSEMSGTTQPTEESNLGSAGPVGGAAWRAGGVLLSELDSEEVSGSQQGASELSAPGVLEGTESMDDLGEGSLKGAIDMEGASAGSPDFEKVPDIPVNDFDEDEEDDSDRVCDMDVGSERTDEPQRPRHDNDVVDDDEDDEDVEMASEGVTESGLESYGNADEDDFAEDERLDNLNRVAQPPPPPPLLPCAPAAQWDNPNPFADPWAEPFEQVQAAAAGSPSAHPWQLDSETPTQVPAQAWLGQEPAPLVPGNREVSSPSCVKDEPQDLEAPIYKHGPIDYSSPAQAQTLTPVPLPVPGMSQSRTLSSETSTPEKLSDGELQPQAIKTSPISPQLNLHQQKMGGIHLEGGNAEEKEEAEPETLTADEAPGLPATAPTSNPSSSSVTEDEASDTEGEAQLDDPFENQPIMNITTEIQPPAQRCLSTVEEAEEVGSAAAEDSTPPSATSMASYGFDTMTTASYSNAQSTGESCIKSPGVFSLEELSEEAKEPCLITQPHNQQCLAEQQYLECRKSEVESAEHVEEEESRSEEIPAPAPSAVQQPEENPDDPQPPYYSICEKHDDSFSGFTALPLPHRRDHAACPRTYYDIIKAQSVAAAPPKLTCADLPPRSLGQQALSPQLRRLEQHQRQLQELQQRRAQQSTPLEEAEQERKRREEEEQRRKKEEAEEEIKRNEEEERLRKEEDLKERKELEQQLQQQQDELKQRQQIMQWQQELQQAKGQTGLLSPSSGLCTIYEALENSEEEEAEGEEGELKELRPSKKKNVQKHNTHRPEMSNSCGSKFQDNLLSDSPPPPAHSLQSSSNPSQDGDSCSPCPPESPEHPPPLDLDWGKKVDIVQQLINQTLLLNGDGCSSLLLLPGGAGGTLSPLESSLWPSLLPPLTPPSATVTSVSSFSPEATSSSPQGEWTVVELETHH